MLYVYGLLRQQPGATLGSGVSGEPVVIARCRPLLAAVGEMADVPPPGAASLQRHDAVVRRLARLVDAVLPARYGSAVADEAALCRAISAPAAELVEALALVAGREQMTLRVFGKRPRASRPARAPESGPGAAYLRERADADRALREAVKPLLEAVAPLIDAERVDYAEERASGRAKATRTLLASVHHLVRRGRARAYVKAVASASRRLRVKGRVSGPSPAYAFAPDVAR